MFLNWKNIIIKYDTNFYLTLPSSFSTQFYSSVGCNIRRPAHTSTYKVSSNMHQNLVIYSLILHFAFSLWFFIVISWYHWFSSVSVSFTISLCFEKTRYIPRQRKCLSNFLGAFAEVHLDSWCQKGKQNRFYRFDFTPVAIYSNKNDE